MRKTFEVYNSDRTPELNLFIEIGKKHITCCIKTVERNLLHSLEFFQFKADEFYEFQSLFKEVNDKSEILSQKFSAIRVVFATDECICIPEEHFSNEISSDYLSFMFGELNTGSSFVNTVNNIAVLSGMPVNLQQELLNFLPEATFVHQYYLLLKNQVRETTNENFKISLIFYPDYFVLIAYANNELQLIQTREYVSSADVLYYVLNVCKQYNLSVAEIMLSVSGMIDIASDLYKTLHKYFEHFSVETVEETLFYPQSFEKYPLHFFSHFSKYEIS